MAARDSSEKSQEDRDAAAGQPTPTEYSPEVVPTQASPENERPEWAVLTPVAVRADALSPGVRVGDYVVEKKLGQGGMGEVHGATHPLIGKRVAIKVLKHALSACPEMVQRFVQEARAVNRIGHPNIVDVFAFGQLPDGRHYSVMEWLRGQSLAERLRAGLLPMGQALEILEDVCRALEAAHEVGVVHRDLKPDNVFLMEVRGARPMVKLLDFGIAKLLGDDADANSATRTGQHVGTPAYSSPEQARGEEVGPPTDAYALGIMAFEMIVGKLPFMASSIAEVLSMQMNTPPPKPRDLVSQMPAQLEDLVISLLQKEPGKRPTIRQARTVLEKIRASLPSELITSPLPRKGQRGEAKVPVRWRTIMAVAAILVVGVAAGLLIKTSRSGTVQDEPQGWVPSVHGTPGSMVAPSPFGSPPARPIPERPLVASPPAPEPDAAIGHAARPRRTRPATRSHGAHAVDAGTEDPNRMIDPFRDIEKK
ncbi:MAG: serine/threonine protein kinase [Deltaproteobacteria bacterium]|nr:serine/threonine protein kinase [Deltaproteobacteria bacterium]